MFFLNVQSFLRPSSFWKKKIGSFSLKMQLKRRREEEIWITKRTLWCYSQVYLSQKKERSRTKTIFKASNDPVSKVKVWILTQIEGRIQENVRIFFNIVLIGD